MTVAVSAGESEVRPVFIPYTLKKGTSFSCECDYKQSALGDEPQP